MGLKNNISMLEDTIITLNGQNQRLKDLMKERDGEYNMSLKDLEGEYVKLKVMYENK